MELRALILVGAPVGESTGQEPERMAGVPFAYLDVLGAPVLERIAKRLRTAGVSELSLISAAGPDAGPDMDRVVHKARLDAVSATKDNFWQSTEEAFEHFRQDGADLVLIMHLGPYVELDYEELIQHHIDKRCRMTSVVGLDGEGLGIFVVDASRRGDATTLFRSGLQKVRDDCERFVAKAYVNLLSTASDFRCLAIDGLLQKNGVSPVGKELKPGVWMGEGAQIHRKARVLAPAFIGARAKIRAAVLLTRNTVIEHHAEIDCGTVVENSTVLPFTYVGAGLDLMHSIVGFGRISHLVRDVAVEIKDEKLIGTSPTNTVFRTLGSTAAFFVVLPKQVWRGVSVRVRNLRPVRPPEPVEVPAAKLGASEANKTTSDQEAEEYPSSFAVVRRYGEH